ncbi:SGNH/GDSL hydrolase family protein [Dyadobacter aurulentus]|uniref:hypothetical protein n=1 Tax=Dyadobacter sp. UC 10 TaxID=2605428 RepID=UPI001788D3B9|nr:hypothetical protein [Dyadobacter sp. UC 10]
MITILSPMAMLAVIEFVLRLAGYGHDLSLFIKDPMRKGYLVMNQHVSEKYFSRQQNATIGNFEAFSEKKPPGTFRIFVLGESTTIGYPYMHNGSFHRWLQYRLMHTFPEKDFELINLSLTAVNSHTVLDFAKTIVDYEPDAVLVYTGHNEYYGAMGVGSGNSHIALTRLLMWLRQFRMVQLCSAAISGVADLFSGSKIDLRENLMKRMASDQQIPYGSKGYRAGISQFTTNMNALCAIFNDRKVPVFISNLVANEKDLKPLMSAVGGADVSADFHYEAGNKLYAQTDFRKAKEAYRQASELDVLRFRAPREINAAIDALPGKYSSVKLVDTKTCFEQHSAHGILGAELLVDHVHPSLYGYGLLSEAFYQAMKKSGIIPSSEQELSFDKLRLEMPVTAVDSLKGVFEVMILKEGWPFNVPMPPEEKRRKTVEEQLAGALAVKQISWAEAMGRLRNYYAQNLDTAATLKVIEAQILENPLELAFYDQAGKLFLASNKNEKGIVYLTHAFRKENNFDRAKQLFIALLKADRPDAALPYIQFAAANNQSKFSLNELLTFVEPLVALKEKFKKDSSNVYLSNQLAAGYLKFANIQVARQYISRSLAIDPDNAEALKLLKLAQTE